MTALGNPLSQGAPDDLNSQAFWNDFMRRPDAKAAYQAELRLQEKKREWLEDRNEIEERSRRRKLVADALEDAPAETKKLIAPIFHIRIVEHFLWMVYDECQKHGRNFHQQLREDRCISQLQKLRESYQDGGEDRMEQLERQWLGMCGQIADDEEKKKEQKPVNADIHTLKHVLEFGQECKRVGNEKFREGLYEEALHIYSQGDEVMKKWKVDKHLKSEHKWLQDYHLACLKNKAQAALKLELFQTALDAAEGALGIDQDDHKALYRKVQALKGLGKFGEAEEVLLKLEDVAQFCPDRRDILRDSEAERKRIRAAMQKHRQGTKDMLGKAFEAGVFSGDRDKELEEALAGEQQPRRPIEPMKPLERRVQLTAVLAGELLDELADAYGQTWFQERVRKCARDSMYNRQLFLPRLKDIAFEVQQPILEKWGFEASDQGVREMTAAIRDHIGREPGQEMPPWLKAKQERCLELLYGGREGGMLEALGVT